MQEGLFVYRTGVHTLLGVRQNNAWQQLRVLRDGGEGAVGNVYRGRVVRVVPGMRAAFVDVGLSRTAFLHLDDVAPKPPGAGKPGATPLRVHDSLLVQVRKEPMGDKGARLTCALTFSGRYVVYTPLAGHVAVSQKIVDAERRAALMALLTPYLPTLGGAVVRTAAATATDAQVVDELQALAAGYAELRQTFQAQRKPGLLSVDRAATVARCCAAFVGQSGQLVCNDPPFAALLADALAEQNVAVQLVAGPEVHHGRKQADKLGFFAALRAGLRREVPLPSGGSLSIDECEAMTVIDVNSGRFVGKEGDDVAATMLALNLEAADAVATALRQRGIGGIAVVDFVDLPDPAQRRQVAERLRAALAHDPGRPYVSNMSELGLVQLTRRRTQPSLRTTLTEPCTSCAGRGRVRAAWQVAAAALDAAAHALAQEPAPYIVLNVAPAVADVLFGAAAPALAELEARRHCSILPVARQHFAAEQVELLHGARPGSVQQHLQDF